MIVRPFRGLRPRADLAERIASPPYDVLNSEEARQLAEGNPDSFLHVIKPEIDLDAGIDLYDERVYAKGAENLKTMIEDDYASVKLSSALICIVRDPTNDRTLTLFEAKWPADLFLYTFAIILRSVAHRLRRCQHCTRIFYADRRNKTYCSVTCQSHAGTKRWRQSHAKKRRKK